MSVVLLWWDGSGLKVFLTGECLFVLSLEIYSKVELFFYVGWCLTSSSGVVSSIYGWLPRAVLLSGERGLATLRISFSLVSEVFSSSVFG